MTLAEAKKCTFTLDSTHFIFNKCLIYTHDGASAKFRTNSQETDYSVDLNRGRCHFFNFLGAPMILKRKKSISRGKGEFALVQCMTRHCIEPLKV